MTNNWEVAPTEGWSRRVRLDEVSLSLMGRSRAGGGCAVYVPEIGALFDAGLECDYSVHHVFVSSRSENSTKNLPYICLRNPRVTVHTPASKACLDFVLCANRYFGRYMTDVTVVPCRNEVQITRDKHFVETFFDLDRIVGFGISQERAKGGHRSYLVLYLCSNSLLGLDVLARYKYVLARVSFGQVGPGVRWSELEKVLPALCGSKFILTHFGVSFTAGQFGLVATVLKKYRNVHGIL